MKNISRILVVLALAVAPATASAATFISQPTYSGSTQERLSGDVYVAAATASITSPVSGDLTAIGGTLQVLAPVTGAARIAGGVVSINNEIGGDLMVAAGTVHLLSSSVVRGDVYLMGGQIIIEGAINGNVNVRAGTLALGPDARIDGKLSYRSPKPATRSAGAVVAGGTAYYRFRPFGMNLGTGQMAGVAMAIVAMLFSMKTLAFLGMAALLVWRWRRWTLSMLEHVADAFWPSVGKGLVYMLLVPAGCVLLLMSFVGTIPGAIGLALFVSVWLVSKIVAGMLLGSWLSKYLDKKKTLQLTWATAISGVILFELLDFVPLVGWLVQSAGRPRAPDPRVHRPEQHHGRAAGGGCEMARRGVGSHVNAGALKKRGVLRPGKLIDRDGATVRNPDYLALLRDIVRAVHGRSPVRRRRCPACKRLTRITTAGCDHCDLEDK